MKRNIVTISAFVVAVAGAFAFKTPANIPAFFKRRIKLLIVLPRLFRIVL